MELYSRCSCPERHCRFKEKQAVLQRAHNNIVRWLLVQQTAAATVSTHCSVIDYEETLPGQSWNAKHASAVEVLTQLLGQAHRTVR